MSVPTVSICIPTYNGTPFLTEALNSILEQGYQDLEIIISDDASNDSTLKIIEDFKQKTNLPLYVFKHKPNGIGANWNNCIKKANGKYIKFLFQDDVLFPNCLETMVKVMETKMDVDLVASKREFIYDKDYHFTDMDLWIKNFRDLQKGLGLNQNEHIWVLDQSLFKHKNFYRTPLNKIGEPSVTLFRKSIVKHIGFFDESLKQILDYEFYYRILRKGKIAIINESLVKFRLHKNQATNLNREHNVDYEDDEGYSKILYKYYLKYLDSYTKLHLLKKHNISYKFYYKLKSKLR